MQFGVAYSPDKDFQAVLRGVKRAEELGFDFVGIFDSPYNFMDVYSYLGLCAVNTSRVKLGPYVTNPLTRHPSVTASAMATVNVMSKGRAFLAMGRGDSAVKQLGWKPARWKDYEKATVDMRKWMRGEPVDVPGAPTPLQLKFAEGEVPISLGVWGPRGAKTAGRLADCATTECAEPGGVRWFADETQKAAKEAGGRKVDFEVSIATYVSDDIKKARDICRWEPEALMNLLWHLMQTYPVETIPKSLTKGFEHLAKEKDFWSKYNWDTHAMISEEHKKLITDDAVDRFCVLGSAAACTDKIRELKKAGVDRFCAYLAGLSGDELDKQLQAYAEKIMPNFK